jgi:Concanavalin A-like lectin/glucanases superfamily
MTTFAKSMGTWCAITLTLLTHGVSASEWIVFRMGEDDPGAVPEQFTSFTRDSSGKCQFSKINANAMRSNNTHPGSDSRFALDFLGSFSGMVLREKPIASDTTAFTIDGFYYIRHTGTRWLFQFGRYGLDGFGVYTTGGNFYGVYQGNNRRPTAWDSALVVPTNRWVRITLLYEAETFRLFVDGVEGTSQAAPDLVKPTELVTLGSRPAYKSAAKTREDFEEPMDGLVDEWRIQPREAIAPSLKD